MDARIGQGLIFVLVMVTAASAGECLSDPGVDFSGREQLLSDREPELVNLPPEPEYPASAQEGWTGRCLVGLFVAANGEVMRVRIIESSGNDEADAAALEAARETEWKPAVEDNAFVGKEVELPFTFNP